VLVMGVGVAGLQAIATAKRLGAIVSATDVRPATKEQVESLGGTFVAVMDEEFKNAQTAGGYAKEMSPEYQAKQAALIAETIKKQDIVITTALIPGRKAPILVTEEMIKTMKPGSVIVDLAGEQGGNTPLTKANEVVTVHGVTIMGYTNLPGRLAVDASSLYARNLFNFISLLVDKKTGQLAIDWNDDIVKGALVTKDGEMVHPAVKG
jgi:H+-translocating NAD(P) transhydrogenase subunit alpha